MKIPTVLLVLGFALVSGCASTTSMRHGGEGITPQKGDTVALQRHVKTKMGNLSQTELVAVNKFIDQKVRSKHSGKDVLVMGVESADWPFFLEGIMRKNIFLNSLPREKERLVFRESDYITGVVNIYYLVRDTNIPKGEQNPLNWFSGKETWEKFVDAKANDLQEKTSTQAFISLFYEANKDQNPELVLVVKENKWDWDRMPHPKETITKVMLVPLLTVKNTAMAKLLQ